MIKLILVRHGESVANKKGIYQGQTCDTGLTRHGEKQAQVLAKALKKIKIDKIISSPLLRTKESAEIISHQLKIPVLVDNRIIEISHGKWEGQSQEWVEIHYPQEFQLWKEKPNQVTMPGGESLNQIDTRVREFLFDQVRSNDGKTLVVVSHDTILRWIIAYVLRMDLNDIWRFHLDNCGITEIKLVDRKNSEVVVLNQTDFLGSLVTNVADQAL